TRHAAFTNQRRAVMLGLAEQRKHVRVRVDDPGQRRMERAHAVELRFEGHGLRFRQLFELDAVARGSGFDLRELGELSLGRCDDQLAATAMVYIPGLAVLVELVAPGDAEARLERAARIVDAGMNDLAIARAGAGAEGIRRLEDQRFTAVAGERAR